jgi:hypothetical protein
VDLPGRFPWPRGSAAAHFLGFYIRIPPCACLSVCLSVVNAIQMNHVTRYVCFHPPSGSIARIDQGLLIVEAVRSHRHTTLDMTPLDEGSARRRDLYLTTHSTDR